jgi:creatine kinase
MSVSKQASTALKALTASATASYLLCCQAEYCDDERVKQTVILKNGKVTEAACQRSAQSYPRSDMMRTFSFSGLLSMNVLNRTQCEEPVLPSPSENSDIAADCKVNEAFDETDEDSYPNFSRHGKNALLPQYLSRDVYDALKDLKTQKGVNFEDIIKCGVSLPLGANPPRGVAGVYAGDAESYKTFAPLLKPLIEDFHNTRLQRRIPTRPITPNLQHKHSSVHNLQEPRQPQGHQKVFLQRHKSNLNPQFLLKQQLDPEGIYILYTRMRLARSIEGFRFAPCIHRSERRQIERLLKDCAHHWQTGSHINPLLSQGKYLSVMEMTNAQHDDLMQRRLLFPDPDEYALQAGFGRDWPDARGLYCDDWDETPSIIIWCNAPEDHLWVISNAKGGDVQTVFTKLSQAVWALETSLKELGHAFVEDPRLGFLNSSPANIGPALRASVYVKLVRLSRHEGFLDLVHKLRLEARSEYSKLDKRFTGIYDIANAEALGKSEVDLINVMIRGVGVLIDLEKRLENGEEIDLDTIEVDDAHYQHSTSVRTFTTLNTRAKTTASDTDNNPKASDSGPPPVAKRVSTPA